MVVVEIEVGVGVGVEVEGGVGKVVMVGIKVEEVVDVIVISILQHPPK